MLTPGYPWVPSKISGQFDIAVWPFFPNLKLFVYLDICSNGQGCWWESNWRRVYECLLRIVISQTWFFFKRKFSLMLFLGFRTSPPRPKKRSFQISTYCFQTLNCKSLNMLGQVQRCIKGGAEGGTPPSCLYYFIFNNCFKIITPSNFRPCQDFDIKITKITLIKF